MVTTTPGTEPFDPGPLQRLLDGRYAELRDQVRAVMRRDEFTPVIALPTPEYRERVLEWAKILAHEGLTAPGFPAEFGGRADPGRGSVPGWPGQRSRHFRGHRREWAAQ